MTATTATPTTAKRKSRKAAAAEFVPPGATSTVTPGGIARLDPDAEQFHPIGSMGVVSDPIEVELPLPKKCGGLAKLLLGNLEDGWRIGGLLEVGEIAVHSPPRATETAYASRRDAEGVGLAMLLRWANENVEATRNTPGEAFHRNRHTAKALEELLAKHNAGQGGTPAAAAGESVPAAASELWVKHVTPSAMIPHHQIERHPINRQPSKEAIAILSASIAEDGQLDACEVRELEAGRYQMISGETRWLACQALGLPMVRCSVIRCDDATAARRVAIYNGKRTDLNPIEKARLIEELCTRHGFTREQAGKDVCGLATGAAASNLVRLLKLPKVWQDRVIAGELKESYARLLVPVVEIPEVMKELDKDFKGDDPWGREYWQDRDQLEDRIEELIEIHTRRLDGSELHPDEIEANRKQLGIVTVTLRDSYGPNAKREEVEVATNVKLFHELNNAAAAKKQTAKAKRVGAEPAPAKVQKSKEELKYAADQRAQQLGRSIGEWKERLIRRELGRLIAATKATPKPDWKLHKLLLHFLIDAPSSIRYSIAERMHAALGSKETVWGTATYDVLAKALDGAEDRFTKAQKLALEIAVYLIAGEGPSDPRGHVSFSEETLLAIFQEWGGDFTAVWRKLYSEMDPMLSEFFEMHRKAELIPLGDELGVYLEEKLGKPQMVTLLINRVTPLPVPKCLLPQPKAAKAKGGKKGR